MAEQAELALDDLGGGAHEAVRHWSLVICNAMAAGHSGGNRALWDLRAAFLADVGSRSYDGRPRRGQVAVQEWRDLIDGAVSRANAGSVASYSYGPDDADDCDELEDL
jgi:hypothetical protein